MNLENELVDSMQIYFSKFISGKLGLVNNPKVSCIYYVDKTTQLLHIIQSSSIQVYAIKYMQWGKMKNSKPVVK